MIDFFLWMFGGTTPSCDAQPTWITAGFGCNGSTQNAG